MGWKESRLALLVSGALLDITPGAVIAMFRHKNHELVRSTSAI
jgi:hypothetical protein